MKFGLKFNGKEYLLEEEGVVRGIIALTLVIAFILLRMKGLETEFLTGLMGTLLGFYFRKKSEESK